MKCKEFCSTYGVTPEVLEELEAAGLIGKDMFRGSECEIPDVQKLNHILTLKNAGMDTGSVMEYLKLEETEVSSVESRLRVLTEQRSRQLDQLHQSQLSLDRIDYLIVDLKKQRGVS